VVGSWYEVAKNLGLGKAAGNARDEPTRHIVTEFQLIFIVLSWTENRSTSLAVERSVGIRELST
jgi:hypothetical protein